MQAVAGPPCIRAPQVKKASLGPRSGLQVGTQGVLPTGAKHSADRPKLASSLLQSKHDGTAMWRLPGRSLGVWEPSLSTGPQGPLPLPTDLPASASQAEVTLSPQAAGDAIFLGGRKGRPRELVFSPLSSSQCVTPQTPDLRACSQGLNSRVRARCLPALCKACKHIVRSAQSCPWDRGLSMGNQAAGVRLRGPVAMPVSPG